MSTQKSKFGSFFTGLVLGGLTGAVVSLMYAPQSGEDTRVLIRDRSTELKDKALTTAEETKERAEDVLEQTRTRAIEFGHRGQELIEEQRHRVEQVLESVKQSRLEKLALEPTTNGHEEPVLE